MTLELYNSQIMTSMEGRKPPGLNLNITSTDSSLSQRGSDAYRKIVTVYSTELQVVFAR